MKSLDIIAADARSKGPIRTGAEWAMLLGPNNFEAAKRVGLMLGPSGTDTTTCLHCTRVGHQAPVLPDKQHVGAYHMYCEEAGIISLSADHVEGYHVSDEAFLRTVATAMGVTAPDLEYARVDDNLLYLGTGHLGKRRFSLLVAASLQMEREQEALQRRNRNDWYKERGFVLCCDPAPAGAARSGFHAVLQFSDVLDLDSEGLQPRSSEIRRVIGETGRPAADTTKVEEAEAVFLAIFKELGRVPRGQEAFQLFDEARPELKISKATLYAAKARAKRKHSRLSNL